MITRILVANRGEIARRIMRTARDLGIETVAVFSDADSGEPFVREADLAVRLPGSAPADTYLRADLVVAAARRTGADAVHPGYGFGSESPAFAQAVVDAGLVWVGPSPASIAQMAHKERAKEIAAAAGVPLAPSAALPADADAAALVAAAESVGFPLLVKASAGGGGKGMRIVNGSSEIVDAVAAARREAASAFGDATVFAERYLDGARHIEVQVFGDDHGNVVHLFERECSIQRRHQKVIEEAPATRLTPTVRAGLHDAAVVLAQAMDYVGAGTVEFLVIGDGEEQSFHFLEMNTRLQVEHPVTEAITGLDLVAWQLAVADGAPLPLTQGAIDCTGHAIEARIYSEDPAAGYLPSVGALGCFDTGGDVRVRVDAGPASGSAISPHYDSMLAKVIAHGPDRSTARQRLARALRGMRIHGPVTNRDQLVAVLDDPGFVAERVSTSFLDLHPGLAQPPADHETLRRHAIAVALQVVAASDVAGVPSGWSNVPQPPVLVALHRRGDDEVTTVAVRQDRAGTHAAVLRASEPLVFLGGDVARNAQWSDVTVIGQEGTESAGTEPAGIELDGVRATCEVCVHGDDAYVDDGLASTTWALLPRYSTEDATQTATHPATPMPGTVTAVEVKAGDEVVAGQSLVVLEAMKMEHRIVAPFDAVVVAVTVTAGQSVDAHHVVAELAPVESAPERKER